MLTVAYLANVLPCAVEPYVLEEIGELRKRGVRVIAGSVRCPHMRSGELGEVLVVARRVGLLNAIRYEK